MSSHLAGSPAPRKVRERKKTAQISLVLDRHLAAYALAAGAAGVSMMALAQTPLEHTIVYTPANISLCGWRRCDTGPINIDLNNDGIADFTFSAEGSGYFLPLSSISFYQAEAGWAAVAGNGAVRQPLSSGAAIGPQRGFAASDPLLNSVFARHQRSSKAHCWGPFAGVTAYLGVRFLISGENHYGWVRLSTQCYAYGFVSATITGYAYNTVANQPIRAGETGETAAKRQGAIPASLGMLGLGASGLPLWRR
jgi:hypothetical protein